MEPFGDGCVLPDTIPSVNETLLTDRQKRQASQTRQTDKTDKIDGEREIYKYMSKLIAR